MAIIQETPKSVKVAHVIEVKAVRGEGTRENPTRIVVQYYAFDGTLLAENDPITKRGVED